MLEIYWVLLGAALGFIVSTYLKKYLEQKGENLATKEDISEITVLIESAKNEYSKKLESVRAELAGLVSRSGYRYQKEYEVLCKLTGCLVELRDATLSLRPILDYVPVDKTEDEVRMARLQTYDERRRKLSDESERNRPFYPKSIYDKILLIQKHAYREATQYNYQRQSSSNVEEYWNNVTANQNAIVETVDDAIESIRERVIEWDSIVKHR